MQAGNMKFPVGHETCPTGPEAFPLGHMTSCPVSLPQRGLKRGAEARVELPRVRETEKIPKPQRSGSGLGSRARSCCRPYRGSPRHPPIDERL